MANANNKSIPIRIGITGQGGFIGWHLSHRILLQQDKYSLVPFEKEYFSNFQEMCNFVSDCDVIVHLAGVNRADSEKIIFDENIELTSKLISALVETKRKPYVLFASSIQESLDNVYGAAKRKCKELLFSWAEENECKCTTTIIPNVFGEFCRPDYNSFVATFAKRIVNGEKPSIINDALVPLVHVSSVCNEMLKKIDNKEMIEHNSETYHLNCDFKSKVSDVLFRFEKYKNLYVEHGYIPELENKNDVNLFNTFSSYIDYQKFFPRFFTMHEDARGVFVETVRAKTGGQFSFSITKSGVTRGNHFHTRKIERFTVLKGEAEIQIRQIGSSNIFSFFLNGSNPGYVDIPVWYTHNIKNIGNSDLYTQFWINEWYDESDADTFFGDVIGDIYGKQKNIDHRCFRNGRSYDNSVPEKYVWGGGKNSFPFSKCVSGTYRLSA